MSTEDPQPHDVKEEGPSLPASGGAVGERPISPEERTKSSPAVSIRSFPAPIEASSSKSPPAELKTRPVVSPLTLTQQVDNDPSPSTRRNDTPIPSPLPSPSYLADGREATTSKLPQPPVTHVEAQTTIDIAPAAVSPLTAPESPIHPLGHSSNDNPRGLVAEPIVEEDEPPATPPSSPPRTIRQRLRRFFSAQGRQERKEAGIVFRIASGLIQITLITIILSLSATKLKSPTNPGKKEWDSCSRPLGVWSALWAARIALGLFMGMWEFMKEREKLRRQARTAPASARRSGDAESGTRRRSTASAAGGGNALQRQQNVNRDRRSSASGSPTGHTRRASTPAATASSPQVAALGAFAAGGLTSAPTTAPTIPAPAVVIGSAQSPRRASQQATSQSGQPITDEAGVVLAPRPPRRSRQASHSEANAPQGPQPTWMNDALFGRLETLLTMTAFSHFVGNQIFLYSSVDTCRVDAPHIWWLAFGIACLGYMVVLEIVLIAVVVFVIGPLLLLTLNLIMICLGRPIDARGNIHIRAEIPKLDQKIVDRIPLVVFIPEKTDGEESKGDENKDNAGQDHTYPPKAGSSSSPASSGPAASAPGTSSGPPAKNKASRFLFLKRKEKPAGAQGSSPDAKKKAAAPSGNRSKGGEDDWEAQFERGEYPFVKLEGNRATCAICLCDFVEPPRRDAKVGGSANNGPSSPATGQGADQTGEAAGSPSGQQPQEPTDDEDQGGSTPGEPLRLLDCGHVFHRQCLDPWLLDVSGRCPTCQRKVEEPGDKISK